MQLFSFGILICLTLFACENKDKNFSTPANDTVNILQTALSKAISGRYMPDASALRIKYKFGDSILLASEILPLNILPSKAGDRLFKIMPWEKICQIVKQDSAIEEVPNYLFVAAFQKNDSGYFVRLESLSCRKYGGGGILALYFRKLKDSFIVTDSGSASIN